MHDDSYHLTLGSAPLGEVTSRRRCHAIRWARPSQLRRAQIQTENPEIKDAGNQSHRCLSAMGRSCPSAVHPRNCKYYYLRSPSHPSELTDKKERFQVEAGLVFSLLVCGQAAIPGLRFTRFPAEWNPNVWQYNGITG